jgi:hypothetical protein
LACAEEEGMAAYPRAAYLLYLRRMKLTKIRRASRGVDP